jgi:hypothetical protein
MTSRRTSHVLLCVGGILAGLTSAGLWSRLHTRPEPSHSIDEETVDHGPPSSSHSTETSSQPDDEATRRVVAQLGHRIESLESQRDQHGPEDSGAPIAQPSIPSPLSPEEERRITEEHFRARVEEHLNEPIDQDWARRMGQAVGERVGSASGRYGFRTVGLECRSSTCLATIEWPPTSDARSSFGGFMSRMVDPECGREGYLFRPDDPNSTSQAQVLFLCPSNTRQ